MHIPNSASKGLTTHEANRAQPSARWRGRRGRTISYDASRLSRRAHERRPEEAAGSTSQDPGATIDTTREIQSDRRKKAVTPVCVTH